MGKNELGLGLRGAAHLYTSETHSGPSDQIDGRDRKRRGVGAAVGQIGGPAIDCWAPSPGGYKGRGCAAEPDWRPTRRFLGQWPIKLWASILFPNLFSLFISDFIFQCI